MTFEGAIRAAKVYAQRDGANQIVWKMQSGHWGTIESTTYLLRRDTAEMYSVDANGWVARLTPANTRSMREDKRLGIRQVH